jgi:molybdopterin molybdotransferase
MVRRALGQSDFAARCDRRLDAPLPAGEARALYAHTSAKVNARIVTAFNKQDSSMLTTVLSQANCLLRPIDDTAKRQAVRSPSDLDRTY